MLTFDKLYLDGAWVEPAGDETLPGEAFGAAAR